MKDGKNLTANHNVQARRDIVRGGVSLALGLTSAVATAVTASATPGKTSSTPAAVAGSGKAASPADKKAMSVGMLIFDKITQLDATGPMEVFAVAGLNVFTVAPTRSPITAGCGLKIIPDYDFASAPRADILCVPGGGGVNPLLTDSATLAFIRRAAGEASYITSVCTGALLLGAAGLLEQKRATTHWASLHFLEAFGAIPVKERVVIDGNLITGGGVTAGIDFGFYVLDAVLGHDTSALTMLALEYDPAPPFPGGSPSIASPAIVARYEKGAKDRLAQRGAQVALAAAKL